MFTHLPLPQLPELYTEQSATGKRFYVLPDGNKYPSITTVLGHKEKPQIKKWQEMLGKKNAAAETNRCSNRGTAVHELVERYINNEEGFTREYQPEHVKMFNQLKFHLNKIDNVRMQEAGLYSDALRVAGRVDCIGEFDGVLSVIDFKTSNNNKPREFIDDYFKQCTAYAIMWHERTGEAIEDLTIIMGVERGMVPLIFKDKIENWIGPLLQDIDNFYATV